MRRAPLALALLIAVLAPSATAQEAPRREVPRYLLPADARDAAAGLTPQRTAALDAALESLQDPPDPETAAESARFVAALGERALPAVVRALQGASWHVRAALVSALAEMETPLAGPLLADGAHDPSFAVREGAVTGLGKIGGEGYADALFNAIDPATEPVWRVRAAAAPALRRALLRGVIDRERGDAALARLLDDPDPDVRRAALREVPQIGSDAALPALLGLLADPQTGPEERSLAVAALRVARHQPETVAAALRRGFLEEDDPGRAGEAGAALLELRGADVLADDDVSRAILHHLVDAGSPHLRSALGRLGAQAAPWLASEAREIARRIAAGRAQHRRSALEVLVEALVEVRRTEAAALARELATGPDAEVLEPETRRFALRQLRHLDAAATAADALRAQFDSPAGDGVRRALLETIVASGGEDVGARLEAALSHRDPSARFAAVDLLTRRPDLPIGDGLAVLAADEETSERLRGAALEALVRRDPAGAASIARGQITHPRAAVRERAVGVLGRAGAPEDVALLLSRLAEEDGHDPSDDVAPAQDDDVARTRSDRNAPSRRRARIRKELLAALRAAAPEQARDALFVFVADDDETLRERAARLLRGLVVTADAPRLVTRLSAEPDPSVHDALLGLLATLEDSADATRVFDEMLAVDGARYRALALLRATDSRLVPSALTTGLTDPDWDDDDRETALSILARHGRVPEIDLLVRLARGATTVELASESMRLLAASGDPQAHAALGNLLSTLEDVEKLAEAAHRIGELERDAMIPELIALLDRWRDPALEAPRGSAAAVRLYRRVAVALGRSGTEDGRDALLRHVLDLRTARAVAAHSVARNGPFQPRGAAPVRCVRGLVCGLAHTPDPTLERRVVEVLTERYVSGDLLRLSEEYLDGVARYLRDPEAYGLPARRRPATARHLLRLVTSLPPRLSENDIDAHSSIASQLQEERRYADAASEHRALVALRDIEDAARAPERRRAEAAKQTVLDALAGQQSDPAAALAAVDALRALDPENGDLAYWQGYGRVKLGHVDDTTRASLVHAVAADERNPTRHLYLGWVVQQSEGPAAALTHYQRAKKLDLERVHAAGGEYLTHRRGRTHLWGFYPYYLARALSSAGDGEQALDEVAAAVVRDDRYAAQALADPVFEGLPGLAETVAAARRTIKASDTE